MDDKRVAYVEDVVNELSDMIDKSFKTIIDNKKFVMPDFESVISKRTLIWSRLIFCKMYSQNHLLNFIALVKTKKLQRNILGSQKKNVKN